MMARYDDVVTDRRLTAGTVNAFLAAAGPEPTALLDEFLVLASGGSSGTRGMYVQHMRHVPDYVASILRGGLARIGRGAVPRGVRFTLVAAHSSVHATRATPPVCAGSIGSVTYVPATLDISTIVQRVQQSGPMVLVGYAGALLALAQEQLAGRLAIHPLMILSTSEQLTSAAAARMTEAFGIPPANAFGSSEGLNGGAPPGDTVFTFASDMAHVEFVDEGERPVPPGTPAHHVLMTNLLNTTQPLIRYRMDDAMTQQPPLPGIGHVRATVEGRTDEFVRLGDRDVHPHVVRSVLLRRAEISEYQVRSGGRILAVDLVVSARVDTDAIARDLAASMAVAGVPDVDARVRVVDAVERDARSGKAWRFGTL